MFHWHKSKQSYQPQYVVPQYYQITPQQAQTMTQGTQIPQQKSHKTESTYVQTESPTQPKPIYISSQNRPVYVQQQQQHHHPNTTYYVVQQPSPYSPYSPYYQQPEYVYHNSNYQDSHHHHHKAAKGALILGAGLAKQSQNTQQTQRTEQSSQNSSTSAYYVGQPNTMSLQRWPQVGTQDGYYPSSGFRNAALTIGASLLLVELLF